MKRTISLLLFGSLWSLAPVTAGAAQTGSQAASEAARWSAWVGCWTAGTRPGTPSETTLCVVPSGSGVRMVTFAGEREVLSETLVADGSTQALREQACSGERVTRWSSSGTRLFSSATLTCATQPTVKTTGISALVSADQWLDVQVADVGGRSQVRTRRFRRSAEPAPAAVADALRGVTSTRPVVAATTVADIIEASRVVAPDGVEAWLAESRAQVPLDRRALLQLSDASVSPHVIDVMVGLAYPEKFEVRRNSGGSGSIGSSGWFDDFYPGDWGYLADVYGYGFGSFGVPYFLGWNGYVYPGGFQYVPAGGGGGGNAEDTSHGQVVNGQGYTQVQPRETVRTAPLYRDGGSQTAAGSRGSADSGSVGSSSGDSGASAASPGGYSGGGGTATGLTAVPR